MNTKQQFDSNPLVDALTASATPKPRAGEHVGIRPHGGLYDKPVNRAELENTLFMVQAERDLLRERERELVGALEDLCGIVKYAINRLDADQSQPQVSGDLAVQLATTRTALSKHGR